MTTQGTAHLAFPARYNLCRQACTEKQGCMPSRAWKKRILSCSSDHVHAAYYHLSFAGLRFTAMAHNIKQRVQVPQVPGAAPRQFALFNNRNVAGQPRQVSGPSVIVASSPRNTVCSTCAAVSRQHSSPDIPDHLSCLCSCSRPLRLCSIGQT